MAAKIDFQFCAVCRRNHNLGRRHIYSKNHCANTKHILNKYGKKVCEKVNVCIAVEERKTLKKVSDHWYHNSVDSTVLMLHYIAGTRPGRAVTREFIGGGVYSLVSVLPN